MAPTISLRPQWRSLSLLALFPFAVSPFSFSYSAPTQCGDLTIKWQGGTPPFSLTIVPPANWAARTYIKAFNVPRNVSIPPTAYSNGQGSFTATLPLPSQKQFLLTMSDASGFGTGGLSDLLTVGDPVNNASCDLTEPSLAFNFQLNTALQQCRPYTISNYNGSTAPVTIYGMIPLGSVFQLNPTGNVPQYTWTADAKAGTRIIWAMFDAAGRTGGSSDVTIVGSSDDTSCITSDSPASTASTQTQTSASVPSSATASPSSGADTGSASSSKGGIIGGAVAGGIVVAVVIGTLLWFLIRRSRDKKHQKGHVSTQFHKRRSRIDPELDPLPHEGGVLEAGHNYEPEPYMLPASADHTPDPTEGGDYRPGGASAGWTEGSTVSTLQPGAARRNPAASSHPSSKFSEAYSGRSQPNTPARFVLHTDAGELPEAAAEEEEVVELPPQYNSITGASIGRSPTYRERSANAPVAGSSSTPGAGQSTGPST
ncbi:hypothetical protein FRB99_004172 [Tulasnella sp. 403]|nr:hypothetical protein FRB99_004172 [Tulasnella sp. 403]